MAKVVNPLMSQSARGKIGSLIFNTWRSFNTVKMFRAPTQPNTAAQLAARARLKAASGAWAGLTSAQRSAWNQYAIDHQRSDWTGAAKRITAQNQFIATYTILSLVAAATITDPPTAGAPAAPTGIALACAGGHGTASTITWTTPVAATSFMVVYECGPISLGRIPRMEQAAILVKPAANTAHPYQLHPAAVAGRYGYWVEVVDSLTGLKSAPVFAELTVA
jgi:hypothetical protein